MSVVWSWLSRSIVLGMYAVGKIASSTLGSPLMGVQVAKKATGGFTYAPTEVEQRVFQPKMYWYPIPESELLKLKKWSQNRDW